jgi:hypothetical protein
LRFGHQPPCPHLRSARVDAGEQPLRGGFFVAGGAVDLAGEEQAADGFGFQRVLEAARVVEIVFDGVAGTQDVAVLQAADRAHQRQLDVEGQAGRHAVRVDLVRRQAFRFEEDVVLFLSAKRWILSSIDGQ